MMRWRKSAVLGWCFWLFAATSDLWAAPTLQCVDRPDSQLQIFELQLGIFIVRRSLFVFEDPDTGDHLLPLGGILSALELAIEVDPLNGRASGWAFSPTRRFELDLADKKVAWDGKEYKLAPKDAECQSSDIYVHVNAIQKWFPLHFLIDFRQLRIAVRSDEPLPLDLRLAAMARRQSMSAGPLNFDGPIHERETQFSAGPFADFNLAGIAERQGTNFGGEGLLTARVSGILADQDIALAVNADADTMSPLNPPSVRLTVGRDKAEGGVFGIEGVRRYQIGDVVAPFIPLVARNRIGRGIRISNILEDPSLGANRLTLRGELPVGWEAELYRNDELLAFQTDPDADGRFEFADVRTLAGANEFKVVLFGPQGQREEISRRFFYSGNRVPRGEIQYDFYAIQVGRDLIDATPDAFIEPEDGSLRAAFQAAGGLTDRWSVRGGVNTLVLADSNLPIGAPVSQSVVGTFGATFFGPLFVAQADVAVDNDLGAGLGLDLQSRFGRWSFTGGYQEFLGLESEVALESRLLAPLRRQADAVISGVIPLDDGLSVSLGADMIFQRSTAGETDFQIRGRASNRIGGVTITTENQWVINNARPLDGSLTARIGTLFGPVNVRGQIIADIRPTAGLRTVDLSANWRTHGGLGIRASAIHDLVSNDTRLTLGANFDFGVAALAFSGTGGLDGSFSLRTDLRLSMGFNPRDNRLFARSRSFSSGGAIAPFVFLDDNGNGTFEPWETPLEGIKFEMPGTDPDAKTGDDGIAFIVGQSPRVLHRVRISSDSLGDPFLFDTAGEQGFYVRPGQTIFLDFPIVATGDVDGTVLIRNGDTLTPLRGVTVLLKEDNEIIREEKTQYDGYFYFGRVPYGNYEIEVISRTGKAPARSISIKKGSDEFFGLNFVVTL